MFLFAFALFKPDLPPHLIFFRRSLELHFENNGRCSSRRRTPSSFGADGKSDPDSLYLLLCCPAGLLPDKRRVLTAAPMVFCFSAPSTQIETLVVILLDIRGGEFDSSSGDPRHGAVFTRLPLPVSTLKYPAWKPVPPGVGA